MKHDEAAKNEPKRGPSKAYEAPRIVEDLVLEVESLACGKRNGRACAQSGSGIQT